MKKKGDVHKVNAYVREYGYQFVLEATERAIDLKNAREKGESIKVKKAKEARIEKMAKEMGVRLL